MRAAKNGFTLIELSIVLVIIGLVSAGVLVGRDLIRAAEIRGDIAEIEKLKVAVSTFRGKYNCIPGDCKDAASLFTGATSGNGNSRIVNVESATPDVESPMLYHMGNEPALLIDHLARANLIASAPFDANSPEAFDIRKGIYPLKSSESAGITVQCVIDDLNYTTMGCHYAMVGVSLDTVNFAAFGNRALGTLNAPYSGLDALNIDIKLDDGKPLTGTIVGITKNDSLQQITIPSIPYGAGAEEILCAMDQSGYYSENTYYNPTVNKLCALRVKMPY